MSPGKMMRVEGVADDVLLPWTEEQSLAGLSASSFIHSANHPYENECVSLAKRAARAMEDELSVLRNPNAEGEVLRSQRRSMVEAEAEVVNETESVDLSNRSSKEGVLKLYPKARTVSLSANQLSRLSFVPSSLCTLCLSRNRFTSLEDLSTLVNLKLLDVSHNKLRSFGKYLHKCQALRTIRAGFNKIKVVQLEPLEELVELCLESNRISNFCDVRSLSFNIRLQRLTVKGNPLASKRCVRQRLIDMIPSLLVLDNRKTAPSPATCRQRKRTDNQTQYSTLHGSSQTPHPLAVTCTYQETRAAPSPQRPIRSKFNHKEKRGGKKGRRRKPQGNQMLQGNDISQTLDAYTKSYKARRRSNPQLFAGIESNTEVRKDDLTLPSEARKVVERKVLASYMERKVKQPECWRSVSPVSKSNSVELENQTVEEKNSTEVGDAESSQISSMAESQHTCEEQVKEKLDSVIRNEIKALIQKRKCSLSRLKRDLSEYDYANL